LHRQSGQAVVTFPDGLGGRRDVLLGMHGTPESRTDYLRVVTEWEAADFAAAGQGAGVSVERFAEGVEAPGEEG
jgi:hypothetical protein